MPAASARYANTARPAANFGTGSPTATKYSTIAGRNRNDRRQRPEHRGRGSASQPMCEPLLRALQEVLTPPPWVLRPSHTARGEAFLKYSDLDVADGVERDHLVQSSKQDRQDIFTFVGFLVLCGTTVAIVAIAKGVWNADQWAALGAIAAFLQAIAVICALALAGQQIRQMRSSDTQRRREALIDRLDVAWVYLDRSLSEATTAWTMVGYMARGFLSELHEITPEVRVRRRSLYQEQDERFSRARRELGTSMDEVLRLLLALGLYEHRVYLSLRVSSMFGPSFAPINPDELTEELASENYDRAKKAVKDLRKLIDDLLKDTAPSRFD